MTSNIDTYKKDLKKLIDLGEKLHIALQYESFPDDFEKHFGDDLDEFSKKLPDFREKYQSWYSESCVLIRQLLPDRLEDFRKHYDQPKSRKAISFENYRIEDCLQGLVIRDAYNKEKAGPSSAIPHFRQQLAILNAVEARFESSLFDIKQLVMADLFDSELSEAQELMKRGFLRAAGAIAGVVLEKHLAQVMQNHGLKTRKKNPTINDFNEYLKTESVIDTPVWRNIQRLGDIRNLCDHNKERAPTSEEVQELVNGVDKFTKTLF